MAYGKKAETIAKPRIKAYEKTDADKGQYIIHSGSHLNLFERFVQLCQNHKLSCTFLKPNQILPNALSLIIANNQLISSEILFQLTLFCYRNGYSVLNHFLDQNDFFTLHRMVEIMGDTIHPFLELP